MLIDHAFLPPLKLSCITKVRVSLLGDNDVTSRSGRKRKPEVSSRIKISAEISILPILYVITGHGAGVSVTDFGLGRLT